MSKKIQLISHHRRGATIKDNPTYRAEKDFTADVVNTVELRNLKTNMIATIEVLQSCFQG